MASVFDYELGDEAVPGYKIVAEISSSNDYRLLKVQGPDKSYKLWKKIDLTAAASLVETRLLGLLTKIDHPGLNRITNLYRINSDKGLIIQTEFPAMTLKDRLNECIKPLLARGLPVRGLGIPPEELLRYMEQMAAAIDFLNTPQHEYKGEKMAIMHRALRPECMLLFDSPAGRVCRVSDFGLAKATVGVEAVQHSLGWSQQEFSPPEFADGQSAPTSDQFSLAAVYYYLRTNELPYTGTLLQQMQAQMNDNPCLELVPQAERDVIRRALSGDPNRRYPSCQAFVQELLEVVPRAPTTGIAGATGSSANMALSGSVAAGAAPRTAAVFYRRGTGLSQMDIELPTAAPGASSGSTNVAGPPARGPQMPISTPQGVSLNQPPVTPPATPAVPASPPAKGPQSTPPAAGRPAATPAASAPQSIAKSGEKPKVYMPRSRAEVNLPPLPDVAPGSRTPPSPTPKPLTPPQGAAAQGFSGQMYPGVPAGPAPAGAPPNARPPQAKFAAPPRRDVPQTGPPARSPQQPGVAQPATPPWGYNAGGAQQARPAAGPQPTWANQQAGHPQLAPPWANAPMPNQPPWATANAGQGVAAPAAGYRRKLWTWIQLVLLLAAAAILAYTFLMGR